jgi:hypothetical protein
MLNWSLTLRLVIAHSVKPFRIRILMKLMFLTLRGAKFRVRLKIIWPMLMRKRLRMTCWTMLNWRAIFC